MGTRHRFIRTKWEAGECVCSATAQLPDPDVAEVGAYASIDQAWVPLLLVALAEIHQALDEALARSEYWESAANRALAEASQLQLRLRAQLSGTAD
jgi:hypothetical protein